MNSELCNNVTRHATYKRYADYCGVEHNHDIDADQDDHDYSIISAISDDSCKIKPPIMIPVEKYGGISLTIISCYQTWSHL